MDMSAAKFDLLLLPSNCSKAMPSQKYYAVLNGRNPGIYESWTTAKQQVDGFPAAKFRGFTTRPEAAAWLSGKFMPTEAPKPDPLGALSVLLGSVEDVPNAHWTFAFDGGSRSNPGRAASAFCAWDPSGALVVEIAHYHYEDRSSNYAEWYALIMVLEYIQRNKITAAVIQGDSMLVIEQVCGRFAVLAPHLRDFARSAADILASITLISGSIWIGIKHVRRALNKAADTLVNEGLDTHTDVRRINISKAEPKPEE